jgi:uncharacterized protein (TIGR03435 family)
MTPLANHLWQSTLVALALGVVAIALRSHRASFRHTLWLAASLKFLLPFSVLVSLGNLITWRAADIGPSPVNPLVQTAMRPFDATAIVATAAVPMTFAAPGGVLSLTTAAAIVWLAGIAVLSLAFLQRWRRISHLAQTSAAACQGREAELLHRAASRVGVARDLRLVLCDTDLEPGVFGILHSVLLWPRSISSCLNDRQIEAVMLHELAHVRRRDNLAAGVHELVQTIFWFHPLVWWIGARLIAERERACDEDVIRFGSRPEDYAEGILKTCEFTLASPLACVSGVTGAELKDRVRRIMAASAIRGLRTWQKAALTTGAMAALLAPIVAGAMYPTVTRAQSSRLQASEARFEVASVKPNKNAAAGVRIQIEPGGRFTATHVTLRQLVREAYGLQNFQISGGPGWTSSDTFDLVAKAGVELNFPLDRTETAPPSLLSQMLRNLLADRFKLKAHIEERQMPVYLLTVARPDGRLGPQLKASTVDCAAQTADAARAGANQDAECFIRMGPGTLSGRLNSIRQLASILPVGRIVRDRTSLQGPFDVNLRWTPDPPSQNKADGPDLAPSIAPIDQGGPTIFTAVQEQLGLKLQSDRGPVEVLVIDSVEPPTED